MLCNLTSDLNKYLVDGQNAVIIKECTEESALSAIKRILLLSRKEINDMKMRARETAEINFDYRNYYGVVRKLISRIELDEG